MAEVDAVIVGAGFAGLYAHHRLRALGLTLQGFEAAPREGGTWYWNAYPGARCDVESLDYCYSFSPELLDEWRWSERYATQPEILRYVGHVADRFDLRRDIAFSTRVTAMRFDAGKQRWIVETDRGDRVSARFVVAAVGCLSKPKPPEFDGLEDYRGRWVQTGAWPHEPVELEGRRVAVIGTGSSAIQSIPEIAARAAHVTVFQRTPNFSLPARNGPIPADQEARVRADYPAYCRANRYSRGGIPRRYVDAPSALSVGEEERRRRYEEAWGLGTVAIQSSFGDLLSNPAANATAADFVRGKIRQIVQDPATAELLSPRDHPLGTKRMCLDSEYYATFNLPHVDLVDIRANPIRRITETGVATAVTEYPADLIVFATGFDAMTGAFLALNVTGEHGLTLAEAWREGPATYLGLMVAGFPNLFMVNAPGSPSVLSNMLVTIEHHVEWIADAIADLARGGQTRIEAEPRAQAGWVEEVRKIADMTLYPQAKSWYNGDNVPGKPRVFLPYVGGVDTYIRRCEAVTADGYLGFRLESDSA